MARQVSLRRSPVDHGFAWIIALAAGVSFFIGAGFYKAYTLVFEQLLLMFNQSATATSLVSSLHGGIKMCSSKRRLSHYMRFFSIVCSCSIVFFLTGPLVAALVNIIGTKRVIFIGAALSFVGFLLSAFTPSLYFMYFSYGILSGFYD